MAGNKITSRIDMSRVLVYNTQVKSKVNLELEGNKITSRIDMSRVLVYNTQVNPKV